jgi:hypothetical protein
MDRAQAAFNSADTAYKITCSVIRLIRHGSNRRKFRVLIAIVLHQMLNFVNFVIAAACYHQTDIAQGKSVFQFWS